MTTASWIDRSAYPFQSCYFQVDGGQMHYIDEGRGQPLVMVHGTPTWSFLYRTLIKKLSGKFRVIAPDHIGFGLSDKPENWSYRPQDHARNLEMLIQHLGLTDIVLVLHDFGGPIGLSYALEHPENIRALVIFNTFFWSLNGDSAFERPARLFNNAIGRWLYLQQNFSTNVMIRSAWGKYRLLTPDIHQHYKQPFQATESRMGTWRFFQSLLGESEWYDHLWVRRDRIASKPALILWGMRDIAFKEKELTRWRSLFPQARVVTYPQVGHYVPDEAGLEAVNEIRDFLGIESQ